MHRSEDWFALNLSCLVKEMTLLALLKTGLRDDTHYLSLKSLLSVLRVTNLWSSSDSMSRRAWAVT